MSSLSLSRIVGREAEKNRIQAGLRASRNLLIEGPVGVGKTALALFICQELGLPVFRVDGDSRYSEQKLAGGFDPPIVLEKGYGRESFIPGPLVQAMEEGGVLFLNELNRLPEGVQNVLLPAIDERKIMIPRLGEIQAQASFRVIATQNPKEFVATSHLSEALLDRFELVLLDYQSEEEELEIVQSQVTVPLHAIQNAVQLTRLTREDSRFRRGGSVRSAIAIAELTDKLQASGSDHPFLEAVLMALPHRVEIERTAEGGSAHSEVISILRELVEIVLNGQGKIKKKP